MQQCCCMCRVPQLSPVVNGVWGILPVYAKRTLLSFYCVSRSCTINKDFLVCASPRSGRYFLELHALSKGTFLYSAVSSPWDCAKRLLLQSLVDLFIPTSHRLLWEAFSYAAITARKLFVHRSTVARYSFIHLGELWQNGQSFIWGNCGKMAKVSKRQQENSNPGFLD